MSSWWIQCVSSHVKKCLLITCSDPFTHSFDRWFQRRVLIAAAFPALSDWMWCAQPPVLLIWWQRAYLTGAEMFRFHPDSHYQGASARLGLVHVFISRTENLPDAGGIFHISHHPCIHGSVINLADRCLLRRYKQPNNRVCSGCDGSRCWASRCLLKMKQSGISSLLQQTQLRWLFWSCQGFI